MPAHILILSSGGPSRNPRPHKEACSLAKAGYRVDYLCIANAAGPTPEDFELAGLGGFSLIGVPGGAALQRLHGRLARSLIRFGVQSPASLGPHRKLLRAASLHPAHLIIAHNELAHWVGLRLLARGRRVAADIEDWHSEDLLPSEQRHRPLALLRRNEGALLNKALYTSTTSEVLANALFARYGGRRPAIIANAFPLSPWEGPASGNTDPCLFWFSQTLGPGRGLEPFIAAWSHTRRPSRLRLLGNPVPGYPETLLAPLNPERRSRVELLRPVPARDLPALIARHQVGLALEVTSIRNRDLAITNKILQYLVGGLAILASHTSGQHEVLDQSSDAGRYLGLQDPEQDARRIDALLASPLVLAQSRAAARALAENHYCWERQEPTLLDCVQTALRSRL